MRRTLALLALLALPGAARAQQAVQDASAKPYGGYTLLTPDAALYPQYFTRAFGEQCSGAGNVAVVLESGQVISLPVGTDLRTFPLAVTGVKSAGTTATGCTYYAWH